MTQDPHFDGVQALELVQRRHTLDYGSRKVGGRAAGVHDEFHPLFFLDMIIVVGRPLQAITQTNDRFFDNVTLSFKNWRASYSSKHIHGFHFDLTHRTFRLATAATRESWYIVMHPVGGTSVELPTSRREQRRRQEQASRSSALRVEHAQFLAQYIKEVFLVDELLGEGVEPSWTLDRPHSQKITFNKWTAFQRRFVEHWPEYVELHATDQFWRENEPAFHAYDYGANIQIEVNEYLDTLAKEISLRQRDDRSDSESDADADADADAEVDMDHHLSSASPASDTGNRFEESMGTPAPSRQNRSRHRPSLPWDMAQEDEELDEQLDDVDEEGLGDVESVGASHMEGESSSVIAQEPPPQHLYPAGLAQLRTELERKYVVENIGAISYALAVDINCLDASVADLEHPPARCLLANRNVVVEEYPGPRDFTFYPLAFHPAYGNFSSPRPPSFLTDHVLTVMRDNMSYRNGGRDPLSYGHFQAYSNIKRSIRHGPDDLLATKGIATGALTLPESEAKASRHDQAKQQKLQRQLLGQLTPDDPGASQPFARECQRLETAIEGEEMAFRMEQVVNVQVSRLVGRQRSFATVLQPIFQLMRFYLQEPQCYTHLLRSFRPTVFPGVLTAYARLFHQAVDEIRRQIAARGPSGLTVALAEGVAALDRLGSYCFTGLPRSLMGSVLRPLGTIDSIEHGAWPYINPRILDLLAPAGRLNIAQWPRGQNGRPILMHVAAISYHYGRQVAASRHSHVWFRELGGMNLVGPTAVTGFLEELFRDLWMPQMKKFLQPQIDRTLRQDARVEQSLADPASAERPSHDHRQAILQRWLESKYPFCWKEYEPVVSTLIASPLTSTKARRDFSRELFDCCLGRNTSPPSTAFASTHATWFAILRTILNETTTANPGLMTEERWVEALSAAMLSNRIECVPGTYQTRLSHRRVVRLVGYTPPAVALAAPPGSLKRAALEANDRAKRPKLRRRIHFGCAIPFTQVPRLVEDGFRSQTKQFKKGDRRILEHYQVAHNCLKSCLGDPLCDLMLMLILTLASCSVTPTVAPGTRHFEVGQRKDPGTFAANMVVRMLWFLRPQHFPWGGDDPVVLPVPEMTQKIEHKGPNNRMLRELGWVKVVKGNRDSPRNSDLALQDLHELLAMGNELLSLRKDAVGFIRTVFHSHDTVWVDRCSPIVQDQDENSRAI